MNYVTVPARGSATRGGRRCSSRTRRPCGGCPPPGAPTYEYISCKSWLIGSQTPLSAKDERWQKLPSSLPLNNTCKRCYPKVAMQECNGMALSLIMRLGFPDKFPKRLVGRKKFKRHTMRERNGTAANVICSQD